MSSHRQFTPAHTKSRRLRVAIIVVVLVALFAVPVIRKGVRTATATVGLGIAHATHSVGGIFSWLGTSIRTKHSLENENTQLKAQVAELTTRVIERDSLARENADLKAAMGRAGAMHFTLASVVGKPPHSLYDTLLIDGGTASGFLVGQTVYASGETPIGTIESVLPHSAIVRLYSAPGQETQARLSPSNIDVTIVGRGGGNFSATVAHDLVVDPRATVVTKEIEVSVIAIFQKITSDPRDPFQTLLFAAPVNVNNLSFVEVRT